MINVYATRIFVGIMSLQWLHSLRYMRASQHNNRLVPNVVNMLFFFTVSIFHISKLLIFIYLISAMEMNGNGQPTNEVNSILFGEVPINGTDNNYSMKIQQIIAKDKDKERKNPLDVKCKDATAVYINMDNNGK